MASGVAAWLILAGLPRAAGGAAAAAGILLLAGPALAGRDPGPLVRFLGPAADRLFDGLILPSLAWAVHRSDPLIAALSVVALSAGFLSAYVRARGQSLGYPVEESAVNRGLRCALVSVGLMAGRVIPALWILVVLMTLTTAVRVSQVAKQERE